MHAAQIGAEGPSGITWYQQHRFMKATAVVAIVERKNIVGGSHAVSEQTSFVRRELNGSSGQARQKSAALPIQIKMSDFRLCNVIRMAWRLEHQLLARDGQQSTTMRLGFSEAAKMVRLENYSLSTLR